MSEFSFYLGYTKMNFRHVSFGPFGIYNKIRAKFNGSCLKQEKTTFTHKQVVNIYIVYKMNLWPFTFGQDFKLRNYFWGLLS